MSTEDGHTIIERQFDSFVKRVLKNSHYDYLRKHICKIQTLPIEQVPEGELLLKEDMFFEYSKIRLFGIDISIKDEKLYISLLMLSRIKREILLYYYFLGFSLAEISKIVGLEKSSVKVYKSQAIREVRKLYGSIV